MNTPFKSINADYLLQFMYKKPFLDKNKDEYFCLREVFILMKRFNRKVLMFVFIVSLIATMLFWGFSKNNEVEALSKYDGALRKYPHPRSKESITSLATYRGSQMKLNYAESFEVVLRSY